MAAKHKLAVALLLCSCAPADGLAAPRPVCPAAATRLRLCASPSEADADTARTGPATAAPASWDDVGTRLGPAETALAGVPLFFLLQSVSVGMASAVLPVSLHIIGRSRKCAVTTHSSSARPRETLPPRRAASRHLACLPRFRCVLARARPLPRRAFVLADARVSAHPSPQIPYQFHSILPPTLHHSWPFDKWFGPLARAATRCWVRVHLPHRRGFVMPPPSCCAHTPWPARRVGPSSRAPGYNRSQHQKGSRAPVLVCVHTQTGTTTRTATADCGAPRTSLRPPRATRAADRWPGGAGESVCLHPPGAGLLRRALFAKISSEPFPRCPVGRGCPSNSSCCAHRPPRACPSTSGL